MGRSELGYLGVGMAGDLFAVKETRLELAGATEDVGSMLATVGLGGPVDYTVVNGRVIVENGRLSRVDEETVCKQCNEDARIMRLA